MTALMHSCRRLAFIDDRTLGSPIDYDYDTLPSSPSRKRSSPSLNHSKIEFTQYSTSWTILRSLHRNDLTADMSFQNTY